MSMTGKLNYQVILRILGIITMIVGVAMLPSLLCASYYDDAADFTAIAFSMILTILAGGLVFLLVKPARAKFRVREGYLTVALCWVVASLFGSLPYLLSNLNFSFAEAFFESVSGFTTTGSTMLPLDIAPNCLILWKAISHWLGGMGILVFVISILPALGINGQLIARAEIPGPVLEKIAVRMSDSAKILYLTYLSFTAIEFLLLVLSPTMPPFEALINTLGSISTGGLYLPPGGDVQYDNLYVEIVLCFFMVLASVNFVLYHYVVTGKWSYFLRDVELRSHLKIITGAIIICAGGLFFLGETHGAGDALRDAFFHVVSFATTSGSTRSEYTMWPALCQVVLFTLLFIGGCAASTSGSIKVIRILVLIKLVWRGFNKRIHPRSVVAVRLGGQAMPAPVVGSIAVFIIMYLGLFLFSCLVLSFQNLDLETTISTAAGLLSNTGPAFGQIGASGDYTVYSDPLKLYLSFIMIVGRLELFTIILLFTRNFWGKDR